MYHLLVNWSDGTQSRVAVNGYSNARDEFAAFVRSSEVRKVVLVHPDGVIIQTHEAKLQFA